MTYTIYLISRDSNGDATRTNITSNVLLEIGEHTKLDESLDLGNLVIHGVEKSTPYTMFDSILVQIDGVDVLSQRISGDTVQLVSKRPKRYMHTLSLTEHTKILELYAVSAKTFRNGINVSEDFLGDYDTESPISESGLLGDDVNQELLAIQPNGSDGQYFYVYSTVDGEYGTYQFTQVTPLTATIGKEYIIISLGTTDWNVFAGTTGVTYAVGDIIECDANTGGDGTCGNYRLQGSARKVYPSSYSILEQVQNLRDTVPLETLDQLTTTRPFVYESGFDFYTQLNETEGSELTFKDLTLKECLYNVGEQLNLIPRLTLVETNVGQPTYDYYMKLGWDSVNELKTLITSTDDFIDRTIQQDTTLYATQMESDTINVVNDNQVNEAVETHPAEGAWISPRTDQYYFDYTKSFIPTPKPVNRIVDVTYLMYGYIETNNTSGAYGSASDLRFIEISLKNWITEWEDYRTKSESARQEFLTYKYKEPNIQLGTTFGLFETVTNFTRVLENSIIDKMIEEGYLFTRGETFTWSDNNQSDWTNGYMLFKTDYIPIPSSARYNIDRQDLTDIDKYSQIISNQQGRIVNLENFTNNMQGKINRIGNSEMTLEHRVTDYDDLYVIGDYTSDKYIITEREVIFYKDYIYAKYQLSKNYNMISKFIGVNSENRQWEIAEQNTLQRKLMYKEYIEVECVHNSDVTSGLDNSKLLTTDGKKCIMDTLNKNSTYEDARGGIVESSETTEDLICDFSSNGGGNSLIFDFQFPSNNFVGRFLETTTGAPTGLPQIANNFATYVDEFGKMESVDFTIFNKIDNTPSTYSGYLSLAQDYPKTNKSDIDITYVTNTSPFVVKKDTAEEIGGTIQFQFVPKDANQVGFGRLFMRRNRLVSSNPPNEIEFYYSTTNTFGRLDTLKVDTSKFTKSSNTTGVSFDYTNQKITLTNTDLTAGKSAWCLTDEQGNILIWCNQNYSLLNVIKFDFLNKRSDKQYKY